MCSQILQKKLSKKNVSHTRKNKNNLELYFREILPDYDEDRVYISDIKKVFQWYNSLCTRISRVTKRKRKKYKTKK